MKIENNLFTHRQLPLFLQQSEAILEYLQSLGYDELKALWKCSDNLAEQNMERVKEMDLYSNLTPAIFSFKGLQYQYMGAEIFTYKQLDYIEEKLRILSGFYGLLRPFDGIVPYRLEMKARPLKWDYETLYEFWDENNYVFIKNL